jgi:hypothetical protein
MAYAFGGNLEVYENTLVRIPRTWFSLTGRLRTFVLPTCGGAKKRSHIASGSPRVAFSRHSCVLAVHVMTGGTTQVTLLRRHVSGRHIDWFGPLG